MDFKNTTLYLFLLGVLLVSGCIAPDNTSNSSTQTESDTAYYYIRQASEKQDTTLCEKIVKDSDKWNCYSGVAESTRDADLCEKIPPSQTRDVCYGTIARSKNDTALCGNISSPDINGGCYGSFATNIDNPQICEKSQSGKDSCYRNVIYFASGKNDSETCAKITPQNYKDECYLRVAPASNKPDMCMKIVTPDYRDVCFSNIALSRRDIQMCKNVVNYDVPQCYRKTAAEIKNSSICTYMDLRYKDYCYQGIAQGTKDPDMCEKIIDLDNKDICYALVADEKKDPDSCAKIDGKKDQGMCYLNLAKERKDATLCERIVTQYAYYNSTEIKDWCYEDVSRITRNFSLCESISDEVVKYHCYIYRDGHDNVSISICENSQGNSEACYLAVAVSRKEFSLCKDRVFSQALKDICYHDGGIAENNLGFCNHIVAAPEWYKAECYGTIILNVTNPGCSIISDDSMRDKCYYTISLRQQNYELCSNAGKFRFECLLDIALEKKDSAYCDTFTVQEEKDLCYRSMGAAMSNLSLCEKIVNGDYRDNCYHILAQTKKDVSLCSRIGSQNKQDECIAYVALKMQDAGLCGKITGIRNGADCYKFFAIMRNDSTLCEKIFIPDEILLTSPTHNDELKAADLQTECFTKIAVERRDIGLCSKVKFSEFTCYMSVSEVIKDPSICEGLITEYADDCYLGAAVGTKDPSICDHISFKDGVELCLSKVSNLQQNR